MNERLINSQINRVIDAIDLIVKPELSSIILSGELSVKENGLLLDHMERIQLMTDELTDLLNTR